MINLIKPITLLGRLIFTVTLLIAPFINIEDSIASENLSSARHFTEPVITPGLVTKDWEKQPVKHNSKRESDLSLTLDQQMYASLLPEIQAYAESNNLKISVNEGTCGTTAGMIMKKSVDIGGFCCPPGEVDRLPGVQFHTLGITALVLFVHPDNPIDNVTTEEARKLFMGYIRKWSALSDPAAKNYNQSVKLVTHIHCKLRPGHWKLLLPSQDHFSPDILDFSAAPDLIAEVASDKRAIGYETFAMANVHSRHGKLKPLMINGVSPGDLEALAQGKYPFYRVFNITTWKGAAANPLSDALAEYLMGRVNKIANTLFVASPDLLKKNGWIFKNNELVGLPPSLQKQISQE